MTGLTEIYRIDNFIDTFALGHYARVLDAVDSRTGQTVAFKVMRSEHLNGEPEIRWEYRAFGSEADLLSALKDSPNIVQLIDCGYVETESEAPSGGNIESFGLNVGDFRVALPEFAARRWRPYLALENLPRTANLLYLMKPSQQNSRWRLPTEEGLSLAVQFAQLLQLAHQRGIVYLDHKLEHVYWDGTKLRLIDLNSSRRVDARTSESQYFRMDIHNLCVGILYPVFTGLSPLKTTLRPQPSSQSEVETRYRDITRLDFGVEPSLSPALQELLQRGAALEIDTIDDFLHDLRAVCARHGWDFSDQYTIPASRDGRDHMRAGLRKLREGQDALREARDIFRDAAVQDGISEDLEAELRRLVVSANHMLNGRVIP